MKRLTLAGLVLAICSCGVLPAGAQVPGQMVYTYNSSAHVTSNATTTIAGAPRILVSICINTKGASSNTATVYDNTAASGTVLGVIDTTAGIGCLNYDIALSKGLTVVTATGTAPDLTVVYR